MPRAAGNSRTYDWLLNGDHRLPKIQLTSVTTIIRDVLGAPQYVVDWATGFDNKEAMNAYRDSRSEEGTKAHEYVERHVAGRTQEPATGFDRAFERFLGEQQPVFTLSESVVFSLRWGYAGTLDLGILESGGRTRIVDVKTRNPKIYAAYDSDLLQTRAYAFAAHEMGLIDDPEAPTGVLMLKENGRYTYDIKHQLPNSAWLAMLEFWKELKHANR